MNGLISSPRNRTVLSRYPTASSLYRPFVLCIPSSNDSSSFLGRTFGTVTLRRIPFVLTKSPLIGGSVISPGRNLRPSLHSVSFLPKHCRLSRKVRSISTDKTSKSGLYIYNLLQATQASKCIFLVSDYGRMLNREHSLTWNVVPRS